MPAVSVCAEDVEQGKPAPESYLMAVEELGCDASDAVVLEDSEAGVASGLAAGCQVIVVGDLASEVTEGLQRVPDLRAMSCVVEANTDRGRRIHLNFR